MSPALPLIVHGDKGSTSYRPDVMCSHVRADRGGGRDPSQCRLNLWVALGSSGSSLVFLYRVSFLWTPSDKVEDCIGSSHWEIEHHEEFVLPDEKVSQRRYTPL